MQKSITQNTSYYTIALTIQKILSFFYFWYISNQLLANNLGKYVFVISFTGLFAIFVNLGLNPVIIREISKNLANAKIYLKNVIGLKLLLAAITAVAMYLAIFFSGKPAEIKTLAFLASFIVLLDAFSITFWGVFRAYQNLFYESIATIIVQIIILTLGFIALKFTGELKYLILALVSAAVFNFIFSSALIIFKLKLSIIPAVNIKIIIHFLKIIPAFGLAVIFTQIYNTSDSILLSYLSSDAAVGLYAVSAKTVYSLQQIIPAAFAAALFPVFSSCYKTDAAKLSLTFQRALNYLIIIGLPLTAGLIILLPKIVAAFWPGYLAIIPTFKIMALSIPFLFLAFPTGYLLNACDRQKFTTINRGAMTLLAIILNLILIPKFSYLGAGITFLAASIFVFLLDWFCIQKIIAVSAANLCKILGKAFISTIIMIAIIYISLPSLSLFIVIPLGALIYFTALILLKGAKLSDALSIIKSIK